MAWRRAIKKGKEVEKMIRWRRASFGCDLRRIAGTAALAAALAMGAGALHGIAAETRDPVIVALGDSLTAGFGLSEDESFPAQLQAALEGRGQNVKVVNAGVSGDTAAAGLLRLDWSLPDDASAVILELGANDALQGLPPEMTKDVLAKILAALKAKHLPVLLAGMEAPRNMGKDYVESFGAIYPALAKDYDAILYPFFLDGVALDPSLMQSDGLHPNAKGVAKIVEAMLPKVEELLARVKPKSG
jgi:acyl-CoA thioesterase-1